MARLFLEIVAPGSSNFQAAVRSRIPNLLLTACVVEINYSACFQAFVGSLGWCCLFFPAISLRMPFEHRFAAWFLARAFAATLSCGGLFILGFFPAGLGIFSGCFNLCCSCFSALLLVCFSACLLFAVAASIHFCFCVYVLHDISNEDKNTQTIPIFRVAPQWIWKVQPPVRSRFPVRSIPTYMVIFLLQV